MLKDHSSFVKQVIAVADCALIFGAFLLAHSVASQFKPLNTIWTYWYALTGFAAFYLYFAWTRHVFSILLFTWHHHLVRRLTTIFFSAGVVGAAILYIIPDIDNSRTLYVVFTIIAYLFIIAEKLTLRFLFAELRRSNRNITPVIIFGRGRQASQICKECASHPEWGLRVVRTLDCAITPQEFENALKNTHVEEVYFCIPRALTKSGFLIDPFIQICEEMGRPARVFLNIPRATHFARWEYHRFLDRPTLISHTVELDPDQIIFKRAFDIAGALVGCAILFAVYPVLALAIKFSSRGPVFFKQNRVGKNGKHFTIYKFRSMCNDAEVLKKKLAAQNEVQGAMFKMKDDPRITPIGKFIRKYSLDELPQFLNVLFGEMSLVGTRPPTPDEVEQYQNWHYRRISIKPGITGLWQVSGRNKITSFDEIVRLDLKYIDSWRLWLDITIIFRTFTIVFARRGAY